ncbi:hypothetical protein Tco_1442077 [Tanacetum coccineum]
MFPRSRQSRRDLPRDNPLVSVEVLSIEGVENDKKINVKITGGKKAASFDIRQNRVTYPFCLSEFSMVVADIEASFIGPSVYDAQHFLANQDPQKDYCFISHEDQSISIVSLTPKHPSDTQLFTVKMEILLEPTSNKLYEDSLLQAGNSCQGELPLKGILPDHRSVLTDPKIYIKMDVVVPDSSRDVFRNSDVCYHDITKCEHAGPKLKDHILSQAQWNNAKDHYTKYKDIIKDYELERMINSKTAELQLVFSGVTFLRGRLLGLKDSFTSCIVQFSTIHSEEYVA